jgi:uncharacterized protein YggU (UPF0235/DUF167 family)
VVFTFAVHVHPGARRPGVGGAHDGRLVVRVRARAVDGAANEEVLTSLATALNLVRSQVEFIRVSTSRDKVVVVSNSDAVRVRYRELLDTTP